MVVQTHNIALAAEALAYVIELYRELNVENGAPTLGTQNQAVEFILADPELCAAVARWAEHEPIGEATTAPPRRLPRDALYERVRACLEEISDPPIFVPRRPAR
jgi:hypothetical protein